MRFHEVVLQASDPAALAAWYREALGLASAPGAPTGVLAGATTLRFAPAPAGVEPRYHLAFNIPEDRIADAVAWLRPRAQIVESDGEVIVRYGSWDAEAVYFLDSAGNLLELIARHALPNASDAPFSGRSLLEVSEVGLPCPSVPALAAHLADVLGIAPYRPPGPRFAPMGDERGLLILVEEGRDWFLTGNQARPFPIRIAHEGPPHRVDGLPYELVGHGPAR